MSLSDFTPTRHKKASVKKTVPKSDHQHEYVRVFKWVGFKDHDLKIKLRLNAECVDCGNVRRKWNTECIEVEVTAKEWAEVAARQKRGV